MRFLVVVGLVVAIFCVIEGRKHHKKSFKKELRSFHSDSQLLGSRFHKGSKHDGRLRGKHLHLTEVLFC